MEEEAQARELLGFLGPESRADVKGEAAAVAAGLTGGAEGLRLVAARPALVAALLALAGDEDPPAAAAALHASRALAHLAAEPAARGALAAGLPGLVRRLLQPGHPLAPLAAAALANLARPDDKDDASCRRLLDALQREAGGLQPLVETLCRPGPPPPPPPPALAALLANLSRLPEARAFLLDPDRCVLQRLLPYTQYSGSSLLRGGVVRLLRNCCFDYGRHEWLLSDQVDVLPFLLLPLAGPEEFPEEEVERLPLDLQYLPPEKQREPDPDIRKLLLEAILLLTATKPGRQAVRQKGAYFILRELHKRETDPGVLGTCEKLIQVLIGDEPEPGMENLLEVEIPAEVEEQLQRLDQDEERQQQQQQRAPSGSPAPQE